MNVPKTVSPRQEAAKSLTRKYESLNMNVLFEKCRNTLCVNILYVFS